MNKKFCGELHLKHLKAGLSILLCIAMIITFFQAHAQTGKIIYVPDNFPTIQAAVDAASSGTTIVVRDGTYRENIVVEEKRDLVIRSEHGPKNTVIYNTGETGDAYIIELIACKNIVLQGFTIVNDKDLLAHGIKIMSDNITIANNIIKGPNIGTAVTMDSSVETILQNNTFRETFNGIQIDRSSGFRITNNLIIGMNGYGINFRHNNHNNLVDHNIISSIQSTVPEIAGTGIIIDSDAYSEIIFNSIVGCQVGIKVNSPGDSIYLNQFIGNGKHISIQMANTTWNSSPLDYIYDGKKFHGRLGNYWDDYRGLDQNHDGVGDTPYKISEAQVDNYPLKELIKSYTIISSSTQTLTTTFTTSTTSPKTSTSTTQTITSTSSTP
ncbi:MAG: right-handed parallel beta-helix repeat-containing protein [Nitrososphaeria archaeon]|nr:right-handed parallel beta-helix repeat-containing protein [Nitrososphaeria archaeon]